MKLYQERFKTQTSYSIDDKALEELLESVYNNIKIEVALDQSNDSTLSFNVTGQFNKYDEIDLELFQNTNEQDYNTIRILLNDMCRKNFIEPGLYLINISW